VLTNREFGEVVGLIYECALDPRRWPEALGRIMRALRFYNASMSLMDIHTGTYPLNITYGIEEPWLSRMTAYAGDVVEQWGGPAKLASYPLEQPLILSQLNPAGATESNRYFTEWARPQGLIDVMGIGLTRDPQMIGTIGMGRHESAGPIGRAEVEAASLFVPHLQRAVAISRLLELRQVTAGGFEEVVRRLSTPVFIVAGDCRLLWLNRAAEELLGSTAALAIRSGRLSLHDPDVARALRRAVAQLCDREGQAGVGSFEAPVRLEDGRSLALHVLPLTARPPGDRASNAVILAGPRGPQHDPCKTMGTLFGLTHSERRVLSCVAEGLPIAEIARRLNIGEATARTHLHQIFEKTGMRRQAELVALIASFSLPLRPG
jgi:DNA-binding CsgD family transcriptional regulator/PAS domain-containing protein